MCNCANFDGYSNCNGCSQFNNCNGCSQFSGNRPSEITADEFSGNRPSEITADFDGEADMYENFFTKNQRARRDAVKQGMASGLSRADARKQALASVPKTTLADIIQRIKNGEKINVIQTKLGDVSIDPKLAETLDELANAQKNTDVPVVSSDAQPTFFEKNKMYIIGGAVLVVGAIVYFKFIKK